MRNIYGIEPAYIIDNNKCNYSSKIDNVSILNQIDLNDYCMIFTALDLNIRNELLEYVYDILPEGHVLDLYESEVEEEIFFTKIGRHNHGPLAYNLHHPCIKEIGSFNSFGIGCNYEINHVMNYISLHQMFYHGKHIENINIPWNRFKGRDYYFEEVEPREPKRRQKRAIIGNDVWLGKNVTITNSANIGNGVIAGAGAIITKDVPDYAVVVGVPARIIRFRFEKSQINALNKICWWNWTDDEIRKNFEDFYLPVNDFIKKYI